MSLKNNVFFLKMSNLDMPDVHLIYSYSTLKLPAASILNILKRMAQFVLGNVVVFIHVRCDDHTVYNFVQIADQL